MCGYAIVAEVGFVIVGNADAEELPPQETEYEQEHSRRLDIWVEQKGEML
jgi:hypothetical protein